MQDNLLKLGHTSCITGAVCIRPDAVLLIHKVLCVPHALCSHAIVSKQDLPMTVWLMSGSYMWLI